MCLRSIQNLKNYSIQLKAHTSCIWHWYISEEYLRGFKVEVSVLHSFRWTRKHIMRLAYHVWLSSLNYAWSLLVTAVTWKLKIDGWVNKIYKSLSSIIPHLLHAWNTGTCWKQEINVLLWGLNLGSFLQAPYVSSYICLKA